jgi:hypothetical protein
MGYIIIFLRETGEVALLLRFFKKKWKTLYTSLGKKGDKENW